MGCTSQGEPTKYLMVHTCLHLPRCVLPQNEDNKNAIEMADEACRDTVQNNGPYPTAHCEDVVTRMLIINRHLHVFS